MCRITPFWNPTERRAAVKYLLTLLAVLMLLSAQTVFAEDNFAQQQEAKHLGNLRQVTAGLPRAGEGYFSPDGKHIIYQAYPVGYPFYQIYVQKLDEKTPRRISTGRGRTTCSYFSPDGKKILFYSIKHLDSKKLLHLPAELYVINADGTGLKKLTGTKKNAYFPKWRPQLKKSK